MSDETNEGKGNGWVGKVQPKEPKDSMEEARSMRRERTSPELHEGRLMTVKEGEGDKMN